MHPIADDGYVSPYLIHWTGKRDDSEGVRILSLITSKRRLLLSPNPIWKLDCTQRVPGSMVCFTDVPLQKSAAHCAKYGRFGIAFCKHKLKQVGAQPVFYATHVWKRDMDTIFKFLLRELSKPTIDDKVLQALRHHFYFIQHYSERDANRDILYYEREWRLGAQSLPTAQELQRDNARWHCVQEGYPPYIRKNIGIREIDDEKEYFKFEVEPVAFLVAPADWVKKLDNPDNFKIHTYEDLVSGRQQDE